MFYTLHVVEPLRYDSVLTKEMNEWNEMVSWHDIVWGYLWICFDIDQRQLRQWLQLRFNVDSTAIRPRYDHSTTCVTTGLLAALRHK